MLGEGVGQKGLALIAYNAGNSDLPRLGLIDGDPSQKGKIIALDCPLPGKLCSVPLKNGIAERVWYRLVMTVDPGGLPIRWDGERPGLARVPPHVTAKLFVPAVSCCRQAARWTLVSG